MQARLFCPVGKFAGTSVLIETETIIGRKPGVAGAVTLSDNRISTEHARIRPDPDEGSFFLEDLDSTNGTFLCGVRIHGPQRLGRLDVVNFGGVCDFVFQVLPGEHSDAAAPPDATIQDDRPLVPPHPGTEHPTLVDPGPAAVPHLDDGEPAPEAPATPDPEEAGEGPRTIKESRAPRLPRDLGKER